MNQAYPEAFGLGEHPFAFASPVLGAHEYDEYVPSRDPFYRFSSEVAETLLAGFALAKPVLLYGPHGCGKSTAAEQAASLLNRPCLRLSLDASLSRMELMGRDAVTLLDGKQVTEFREGPVPWAARRPFVLILDEYDAARPETLFLFQRLLEARGSFVLPESNRVIPVHPEFRLAATANTGGGGDDSGLYAGTRRQNMGHMDRWALTCAMGYAPEEQEVAALRERFPKLETSEIESMAALCALTRAAAENGDLAFPMSFRCLTCWAELRFFFNSPSRALKAAFGDRLPPDERPLLAEFFQRCFAYEM